MNVEEAFSHINSAYRGSDDDAPVEGTPDFTLWFNTINRKIAEWATDGRNNWQSLFEIRDIGTVSAGTQSYDLDDDFLTPSDFITVTDSDGRRTKFWVSKPQERDRYLDGVYIYGRNPQVLEFVDDIVTGANIVGGTINVPGYYKPQELTDLEDTIPVDDPYWLVMAVASELAFNDLTYESKAADLNAKANNLYAQMASNNRRGTSGFPRTMQTNVNRIPGAGGSMSSLQRRGDY